MKVASTVWGGGNGTPSNRNHVPYPVLVLVCHWGRGKFGIIISRANRHDRFDGKPINQKKLRLLEEDRVQHASQDSDLRELLGCCFRHGGFFRLSRVSNLTNFRE